MMARRCWWLGWMVVLVGPAVAADPSAWAADYQRAKQVYDTARDQADLEIARALVDRSLKSQPPERRLAEVQFLRGCVAYDLGDAATAVAALRAAVEGHPESPQYLLWLGYAYDLDGRTTLAVRAFRRVYADQHAAPEEVGSARQWLETLHESPDLEQLEPSLSLVIPGAVISYHPGEPFVAGVREALSAARRKLLDLAGIEAKEPVEVVLFRDEAEYRGYHERRQLPRPEWSTACTVNGRIFTYPAAGEQDQLLSTVTHEYTHVALRSYADDRVPPCWLDEGLAVLISGQFPNYRRDLQLSPQLLTAEQLDEPTFSVYDRPTAYVAYAQSKSLTEYLLRAFDALKLRAYLRALGRGVASGEAFESTFGLTFATFHQAWLEEL
ncbi:MAG: tetratricopeptide repeat protein, partial [Armatimonadetes bacterium]|nr:tetratricopeptide repeat protein [Armatimonadota bacterium]